MLIDLNLVKKEVEGRVEWFTEEVKKFRTGKATLELFENIKVEAYGAYNKLSAVGNIIIEDAVNVRINVWDKSIIPNVEKALLESKLGATVLREVDHVRLKFSPLTEDDRKLRVKDLKQLLEESKVAVRQVRHKFMKMLEELESVSEDDQKRDEVEIQKIVDDASKELDELAEKKESDIMTI